MHSMLRSPALIFSRVVCIVSIVLIGTLCIAAWASADPENTLYSFTNTADGQDPSGSVAIDSGGNLYTTALGGANGVGTIVEISPTTSTQPSETTLFTFPNTGADGEGTESGPTLGKDGNLYGATILGGANGAGTIYELTLPASGPPVFSVLYSFAVSDPNHPFYGMVQGSDPDGTFYGAGSTGGANLFGGIFSFDPVTDSFSDLYDFTNGDDGAQPYCGVALGPDGSVYGTASSAGLDDAGVVFKLTPISGTYSFSVIYTFTGLDDGLDPLGAVALGSDGSLNGVTAERGVYNSGTLYRLTPDVSAPTGFDFSILHAFDGQDGVDPAGGATLGPDGSIYGTCQRGGLFGHGTVFKYTVAGGFILLHSFSDAGTSLDTDGNVPAGPLTVSNGVLYGTTMYGGDDEDGTVFDLSTGNPPAGILWENSNTGAIYLWNMSFSNAAGYQLVSYPYVATVSDTTWQIAAAADVTGWGVDDLIWQNSHSGDLYLWIMQSDPTVGYGLSPEFQDRYVGTITDTNWKVAAAPDINDDGVPDLIWQNFSTGLAYDWIMNTEDSYEMSLSCPIVAITPNWHIEAAADIDRDGVPDLIWRNTATGDVYWWNMTYDAGTSTYSYNTYSYVATVPDLDFKIVGCADINGDGIPDLLWQNTKTGALFYWLMALNRITGAYTMSSYAQVLPAQDPSWRVAAFGLQTAGQP